MIRRYRGILTFLGLCTLFVSMGCGGAKTKTETQSAVSDRPVDPFAGQKIDLREGGEGSSENATTYDPNDLSVPGAEYGIAKVKAAKKCPKGKKGNKCRESQGNSGPIPESGAIVEQMEGLAWGMHYKAVLAHFEKKIREQYDPELKSANGAIEEDRIRSQMTRELNKLRSSYIEFSGQRTGYEGAVLEDEFTHNNGESLIEWDAGKYVEYLFFFNGRYWKRLRTFRKDSFNQDITFETFVNTLTNRFGEGKRVTNPAGEFVEIIWQNDNTYMSAKDKSNFYGVYCQYLVARVTQDNLAKLRTNSGMGDGSVDNKVSSMVTAVTSGELSDNNASVIDSYTGSETNQSGTAQVDGSHSVMGGEKSNGDKTSGDKKKDKKKESDSADIF